MAFGFEESTGYVIAMAAQNHCLFQYPFGMNFGYNPMSLIAKGGEQKSLPFKIKSVRRLARGKITKCLSQITTGDIHDTAGSLPPLPHLVPLANISLFSTPLPDEGQSVEPGCRHPPFS